MSVPLVLVAAVAKNGVIGRAGGLPWRLSGDLKHFKASTMGRPMIMGRKTFESIGRPLPGRESIVVTRDPGFAPAGAHVVHSIEAAIARGAALAAAMGVSDVAVIGGEEIYRQTIGRAERLIITEVDLAPEGDARFPPIDPADWVETGRVPHPAGPKDEAAFTIVDYLRRTKAVSRR